MPKVSIVTPVYNGAEYIRTCIESVQAQTHSDWEHVIVNNVSTDNTLQIVEEYAASEPRARVYSNERFVTADENHNIAFRLIAPDCKYVKVVCADDWITPECVEKMVDVAERHPDVGMVGCYQQSDAGVLWQGISPDVSVVNGREIGREALLNGLHVLGAPTSVLYRADLIRARESFYPHSRAHADTDAAYEVLTGSDLGFVHEVLAFDRIHPQRVTSAVHALDADVLAYIEAVKKYGSIFLTPGEQEARARELEDAYYECLGRALLKMRGRAYWTFQLSETRLIGLRLSLPRLLLGLWRTLKPAVKDPVSGLRKCYHYYRERVTRA